MRKWYDIKDKDDNSDGYDNQLWFDICDDDGDNDYDDVDDIDGNDYQFSSG